MREVPSAEAVAIFFPVALKVTSSISSSWPCRVYIHFPVFISHSLLVLSIELETQRSDLTIREMKFLLMNILKCIHCQHMNQ